MVKGLTSENDDKESQTRIAHGLLFRFQLMVKPMMESPLSNREREAYFRKKQEEINQGLELIPKQLRIRKVTDNDVEKFKSRLIYSRWSQDQIPRIGDFLIEWEYSDLSAFNDNFNPIFKTLLALRLLKPNPIYLNNIYSFIRDSNLIDTWKLLPRIPEIGIPLIKYTLWAEDKETLTNIIEKINATDFTDDLSTRIVCERFGRFYHDIFAEDKLIDLCIGFEALFLKGEYKQSDIGMGQVIGLACSMLLGKDQNERDKILKNIKTAFSRRNDIVHGRTTKLEVILDLLPDIENYLRRSILRLIP